MDAICCQSQRFFINRAIDSIACSDRCSCCICKIDCIKLRMGIVLFMPYRIAGASDNGEAIRTPGYAQRERGSDEVSASSDGSIVRVATVRCVVAGLPHQVLYGLLEFVEFGPQSSVVVLQGFDGLLLRLHGSN